jgi:hypothetical protein
MAEEILIQAEKVSKKYCKELKRSLLYRLQDISGELNPFVKRLKTVLRKDKIELEILAMRERPKVRWNYSQISTIDTNSRLIEKEYLTCKGADGCLTLLKKALNHELITVGWTIEKSLMNELECIFDESLVYVGD